MKKKSLIKRGISLIVSTALLLGTLSGCSLGKQNDSNLVNDAVSGSKDYVFRSEKLDIISDADYSNIQMVGDKIYASTYTDGENITISSFNPDGSDLKSVKIPESDKESHGELTYDDEGNLYCILYYYYYTDADGNIVDIHIDEEGMGDGSYDGEEVVIVDADGEAEGDVDPEAGEYYEDEDDYDYHEEQYLMKYDAAGNEQFKLMLSDGEDEENYFSLFAMVYDKDNGLILSSNRGIEKFNEDTQTFTTIVDTKDSSNEYYERSISLYKGYQGKIFASIWGDNGLELRSFDPSTGKFGDKSEEFSSYDDYSFFGGNGYDLYVSRIDGFYGYDLAKDKLTKILDYMDSDLTISYAISSVVAVSDTEFVGNLPDEEYNYSLYRLTKVPADQVKDREIITLAGNCIDYDVRQMVYKFNQDNDEYKIKVVDYDTLSNDEDWNAGLKQFNLDIVSGNTPDIMFFCSNEPVDSYINKGLFLDLSGYMNSDPELKDMEFVDNVFNAFKTGDKLYQIVPSFYVNTVAAKTSNLRGKENLSLKECKEMIEQMGISYKDSFGMCDRETILYYALMASGNTYIDWENKKCNLDSEAFIELLEFAKEFPEEITDDMWMDYDEGSYRENKALFSTAYFNGFRSYKRYTEGTFGDDVTLIGFPNEMNVNCSILAPNIRIAISSQTKHADKCWELVRNFYLDSYQDTITYDFPIRKDKYDKLAEDSKERESWTDDDGVVHYEDEYYWIGDTELVIPPMTQEDVDFMKRFIESLSLVMTPNEDVYNIITEEAKAYFEGQKTAGEVAEIIQSRVSIYVNENS